MKITIVGAGAIGGIIGAYLTKAGEDITLVDQNKAHVRKMQQEGLRLETQNEEFIVPVKAMTTEEFTNLNEKLDVVFLAVKAQHTESAILQMKDKLHEDSMVVSLQNGLCEDIIASLIGEQRTIGSFVNIFADYIAPGHVKYGGVGSLYIGELNGINSPRLQYLEKILRHWGNVKTTSNIRGYLWGKMSYASILIATALTDEKIADVLDAYENREILIELASEALAVADALNITPCGFDDWEPSLLYPKTHRNLVLIHEQIDKHVKRLRTYKKVKTGFWRDLNIHKRKTEVPYYLNPIIEIGQEKGIDTVLTQKLLKMIDEIERGAREVSINNLKELKDELVHE